MFYSLFSTGSVDLEELILAFKELGIDIDKAEATKLLERYANYLKLNCKKSKTIGFLLFFCIHSL